LSKLIESGNSASPIDADPHGGGGQVNGSGDDMGEGEGIGAEEIVGHLVEESEDFEERFRERKRKFFSPKSTGEDVCLGGGSGDE